MKRYFLFLPLLCVSLGAADKGQYLAFHAATLSATTDKVTVQQPSSGQRRNLRFISAWVYCSVACVATPSQNGTAASTTALATTPLNTSPPSTAVAFSASNVGTGTVWPAYNIPAGGIVVIDLSTIMLTGGPGSNLSVGVAAITGNSQITIQWVEE